jgi:hypothetical protein
MKLEITRKQKRETFQRAGILVVLLLAWCGLAGAQHWAAVTPFPGSAGTALLRTDGDVMVEDNNTGNWYKLAPDLTGGYNTSSWILLAHQPPGYNPLYFGSAVLPDDRMVFEGGEYNFGVKDDTTLGFIFDEHPGTWTSINHPIGWGTIGDGPTVVLANGHLMLGDCCSPNEALLDATTLTWTSTGSGKADANSEEGWTLLPNATGNKVLTVDTQNGRESELYDPSTGKWSLAGNTPSFLGNSCGLAIVPEMGPAVLRPNGTVFQVGANGKTAIYNSSTGQWSAGPSFPTGLGVADGPAAILPDGNVLVMAGNISPCFTAPSSFYEFNGSTLTSVPAPPNAVNDPSFYGRLLVLPNGGHVLFTDGSSDVEVYIPKGSAKSSWAPTITSCPPATVTRGTSYTFKGTQLNGLSQGAAYGDDAQSATNFPLVRFTMTSTGNIYYGRTHGFGSMGVQTGATVVSAQVTPLTSMATGAATMVVVTNGIQSSNSCSVTVK